MLIKCPSFLRYLYEKCDYDECQRTCAANRDAVTTLTSAEDRVHLEAAIISHESQVFQDLGETDKAIQLCRQGIDIRLSESPRKEVLLAFSASNLGLLYHDAHDLTKALEWIQRSREHWATHFGEKSEAWQYPASFTINEARCMIDGNDFDTAEKMLDEAVARVQGEKPLNFGLMS
jgi:tetratricopeptide (TPR) repeat protein